jgi:hypothetical protein
VLIKGVRGGALLLVQQHGAGRKRRAVLAQRVCGGEVDVRHQDAEVRARRPEEAGAVVVDGLVVLPRVHQQDAEGGGQAGEELLGERLVLESI